jgi:tRNA nucleotidyltransferase/poly(A) polymerase
MHDPARQREFAFDIAQKLRAAGFEALWAGGCVRDELLGLVPKDYDVATNATPDQIRNLFGRRRTVPIGAAFGVITVLGPHAAGQIEVATFRADATYSDGRHPDSVSFTTAEHDAQRRDFTINGLFFDPVAKRVVDYVGGQEDLDRKVLRAIGDPRLRFGEDKLRMLRAVRFAAAFNFTIDPATLCAIQEMADQINTVSAERIGMEIRRMLTGANRSVALSLLCETSLLSYVLPEIEKGTAGEFDETKRILAALKTPSLSLALAALLQNARRSAGSPLPAPCSLLPASVGRRLRYTNKEIELASWLLNNRPQIEQAKKLPWPKLQRILTHEGATELLALHEAVAGSDDAALAFCRERIAWPAERLNPLPLVDGSDLIRHGLEPGPQFAELLEQVRDAQLNGEIHTRDDALAMVDRFLGRH